MKTRRVLILAGAVVLLLIMMGAVTSFGSYRIHVDEVYVSDVSLEQSGVLVKGDLTSSASGFSGYRYRKVGDTLKLTLFKKES